MSDATTTPDRQIAVDEAGWGEPIGTWQPDNPVFWIVIGALGYGFFNFTTQIVEAGARLAPAMIASTLCWSIYVNPWAWFIHHKDRMGRETRKLAVLGFLWGGLAATFVMAVPGNAAFLSITSKLFGAQFAQSWGQR